MESTFPLIHSHFLNFLQRRHFRRVLVLNKQINGSVKLLGNSELKSTVVERLRFWCALDWHYRQRIVDADSWDLSLVLSNLDLHGKRHWLSFELCCLDALETSFADLRGVLSAWDVVYVFADLTIRTRRLDNSLVCLFSSSDTTQLYAG